MGDGILQIEHYLQLEIETLQKLDHNTICQVIQCLEQARERSSTIFICGNGGSASTASHFVCDFNKGVSEGLERKYNFLCLNDNVPLLMAAANDYGYETIFEEALRGRMKQGDLLIVISGSGNSRNVIRAIQYTQNLGNKVIGITGYDGGEVGKRSDYHLNAPVNNMQVAEDIHLILDHLMMWVLVESRKNKYGMKNSGELELDTGN